MSYADAVGRSARRVVLAQALLTLAGAVGFGWWGGRAAMLAGVYGGTVTMVLTLWLAWRVRQAAGGMGTILSGALGRYALAAAGIAFGIGWLKLPALPLVCGFAVTQFGFVVLWRRS
jgi:F0F1-type ATP synthase assembly protein I